MNKSIIGGILLFSKPNPYTKPSQSSPHIHCIPYEVECMGISKDESFAVGTQCGAIPFQQSRVDEYIAYKKGELSMVDILLKNSFIFYKDQVNDSNWRGFYNLQYKWWFSVDLIDVY